MARKKLASDIPLKSATFDEDFSKDTGWITPEELIEAIKLAGVFVYDLETTGLIPREGRIEGVAFYVPAVNGLKKAIRAWFPFTENTMVYVKGKTVTSLRQAMDQADTMRRLKPVWSLPNVTAITANGKFDMGWMRVNSGLDGPIEVTCNIGDSMLCDYMADERHRRYGLKERVEDEFHVKMTTYAEASMRQGQFSFMRPKPLGVYAMDDCIWTYRHHERAMEKLRAQDPGKINPTTGQFEMGSLEKIYWHIEMKMCRIILEMETTGCLIDWEHLVELERKLESKKADLLKKIIKSAGWAPNLRSPSQVSDFLFNAPEEGGLGLPTEGLEQNASGDYSTSEKVIKHFGRKNELVRALLDYRSLEVIDRSFCKKLIKIAQNEGRVYTGFNQTGTQTGRLSSSKPINLQNQPRDKGMIRKAFVARLPWDLASDLVLLDGDFSQVELRLAAHLANEPSLLEVYCSGGKCACDRYLYWNECKDEFKKGCKWEGLLKPEGVILTPNGVDLKCPTCNSKVDWQKRCRHTDVHQRTSEDVGVPRNPLSKNLNFGVLYRIGPGKFVVTADLFDADGQPRIDYARELIEKWMNTYSRIPDWHWEEEQRLKKNNWIAYTLTRRRRRLDEERKFNEYSAITQAINFRVQGTAQDIIKIGMIRVYEEREKLIANSAPAERKLWEQFRFLVQVHDEVMWQIPKQLVDQAKVMIKDKMENAAKLRCPLVFEIKSGPDWESCH